MEDNDHKYSFQSAFEALHKLSFEKINHYIETEQKEIEKWQASKEFKELVHFAKMMSIDKEWIMQHAKYFGTFVSKHS